MATVTQDATAVRHRVMQDAVTIRRLRVGVGLVGMALPFAVTIGNAMQAGQAVLLDSISGSYYTGMRDVFVGALCAIGVFLVFYRYSPIEDVLGTIAGLAAITVALFPTTAHHDQILVSISDTAAGIVHGVAAIVLFLILAVFCFFLFPRSTNPEGPTRRKKARNVTYYLCGCGILAGVALAAMGSLILPDSVVMSVRPLFWGESIAVLAFGTAWMAKSNTILKDVES